MSGSLVTSWLGFVRLFDLLIDTFEQRQQGTSSARNSQGSDNLASLREKQRAAERDNLARVRTSASRTGS